MVRRLRGFTSVKNVYEITGDFDVSAFVDAERHDGVEQSHREIRTVPGVKRTETRMVLKKYNGK